MAKKDEKTKGQSLKEELFYKRKNCYEDGEKDEREKAFAYAENYRAFLDASKTEREAVASGIALAKANGFVEYHLGDKVKRGGKYYMNNREKNFFAFVVGSGNIEDGVRVNAAHIDSPRLDLKQHPLYEQEGFGYLKTHYYGGIKKYQWVTIPLALHGTVCKLNGERVNVVIGEDPADPVFCITDLLPHLAQEQAQKPLGTAFSGEGMNLLIGAEPYPDEKVDEKVKLNLLAILNEKYGITEADFMSAELSAVPADKCRDLGLDRSLLLGYGHDDRVCAYPALTSLFAAKKPEHTLITILADKEEIGSVGATGMQCALLVDLIDELAKQQNADPIVVRANSVCLSADVSTGYDPMYGEVSERNNCAYLAGGVVMAKYTGSRGKSGSNDAGAEYVSDVRRVFEDANVVWQTAELGRVDVGGGGTVAAYIANQNISTVDLGVPVLCMHAPLEVISKYDLYETHKAFTAFCEAK